MSYLTLKDCEENFSSAASLEESSDFESAEKMSELVTSGSGSHLSTVIPEYGVLLWLRHVCRYDYMFVVMVICLL